MDRERASGSERLWRRVTGCMSMAGAAIGGLVGHTLEHGTVLYALLGALIGLAMAVIASFYISPLEQFRTPTAGD
jgi:hypothetical protein